MEWSFWQIAHKIVILFILIFTTWDSFYVVLLYNVLSISKYRHIDLGFCICVFKCRNFVISSDIVILVFSFILLSSNNILFSLCSSSVESVVLYCIHFYLLLHLSATKNVIFLYSKFHWITALFSGIICSNQFEGEKTFQKRFKINKIITWTELRFK